MAAGDGEDGIGALAAGVFGDEVGAFPASVLKLGEAVAGDKIVIGDGEEVGEVVGGASRAETRSAMAMKIRARTTTWRAINKNNINPCF